MPASPCPAWEHSPKNQRLKNLSKISLPTSTVQLLKEYRREWPEHRMKVGDLWQGSNRLWTTWDGRPVHARHPSKWFTKFLERHGLPHMPFHGLRHTSATLLIRQGIDVRAVSSRLGHSRTSTTLDVYVHELRSGGQGRRRSYGRDSWGHFGVKESIITPKIPNGTKSQIGGKPH